mmetsp:Transcript_7191/g.44616  ORF Transcript_7191/g.44616 Transcript_7191/m.44616 type:complete len:232 (+) Transcript_7191:3514-4209(+)
MLQQIMEHVVEFPIKEPFRIFQGHIQIGTRMGQLEDPQEVLEVWYHVGQVHGRVVYWVVHVLQVFLRDAVVLPDHSVEVSWIPAELTGQIGFADRDVFWRGVGVQLLVPFFQELLFDARTVSFLDSMGPHDVQDPHTYLLAVSSSTRKESKGHSRQSSHLYITIVDGYESNFFRESLLHVCDVFGLVVGVPIPVQLLVGRKSYPGIYTSHSCATYFCRLVQQFDGQAEAVE